MINNPEKRFLLIFFLLVIQLGLKAQTTSILHSYNDGYGQGYQILTRSLNGDLFYVENANQIMKLASNGTVNTFFYAHDDVTDLAVDPMGNLYIATMFSQMIQKVNQYGQLDDQIFLDYFYYPSISNMTFDSQGNLYFTGNYSYGNQMNYYNGTQEIYTATPNGMVSLFYSGPYSIGSMAINAMDELFFEDDDAQAIYKININTLQNSFVLNYSLARNLTFDGLGNLYFLDSYNSPSKILKVSFDGFFSEYLSNNSYLNQASNLVADPQGNLYYIDFNNYSYSSQIIKVGLPCLQPSTPLASDQSFEDAATVANLIAIGDNIKWYNTLSGGSSLLSSTNLRTKTYYVTQTVDNCESNRVPILVTINIMGLNKYGQNTTDPSFKVSKNGAINSINSVDKYGKSTNQYYVGNGELNYEVFTAPGSHPYSAGEFASFVNPANLTSSGSNSGSVLLNWENSDILTNANIAVPNGGEQFAVQVSGFFIPQESGLYTFTCEGDDAVDLFINDSNVANHYGGHGTESLGSHTGTIQLVEGVSYLFRARMQENGGGEGLRVFWRRPSENDGWNLYTNELSSSN